MRKTVVAFAIGLIAVTGVAQAEEVIGHELIVDYATNGELAGSDLDLMWVAAWRCFSETESIMMGANLKAKGASIDDVEARLDLDPKIKALFKEGFKYEDPFDLGIGRAHAQCLIDRHKKIASE